MMITIFTPTYNRGHLLTKLYDSLCKQTIIEQNFEDTFEWIVVDDGSEDNTEVIMNRIIAEKIIPITYIKKSNGGKHTAINRGVLEAKGSLFWILDSDDSLPVDAVELLLNYTHLISDPNIGGICGYMAHHTGEIIGKPIVNQPQLVSSIDMRYIIGVKGDMMEVFKTSVLRAYPFPEIPGERFCPEVLIWYRIAQKYTLLLIPEVIYYRDYLAGGLTDNIIKIRMNSPVCTMMTYSELFSMKIPVVQKIRNAINYWRFSFCTPKREVKISSWGNLLAPIGLCMHLRDKITVKR